MIDSFSHIPRPYGTVLCYMLVTSLRSMLTVNDARCTNQLETANKQRINQLTNGYFIKMDLQEPAYQPQ